MNVCAKRENQNWTENNRRKWWFSYMKCRLKRRKSRSDQQKPVHLLNINAQHTSLFGSERAVVVQFIRFVKKKSVRTKSKEKHVLPERKGKMHQTAAVIVCTTYKSIGSAIFRHTEARMHARANTLTWRNLTHDLVRSKCLDCLILTQPICDRWPRITLYRNPAKQQTSTAADIT